MKLSGEATLRADVARVYAALNDPAVLVRTIPGCQRLEQVGPDSYRATVTAGVASIKGTFDGDVRLTDQVAPHTFTLHASGAGAPGTVSAVARVVLAEADEGGTRLTYDADATIGGVIGGVGQRMLSGVARKTAGEFFAAVDRALAGESTVSAPAGVAGSGTGMPAELATAAQEANMPAPPTGAGVWHAPAPVLDPGRQRARDLLVGAAFGAIVALLGVLLGALVSRV
jgi:carbon monoxide dehydrogenase subunit G